VSASKRKRFAFFSIALSGSLALSLLILEIGSRWVESRRLAEPGGTRMVGVLVPNPRERAPIGSNQTINGSPASAAARFE